MSLLFQRQLNVPLTLRTGKMKTYLKNAKETLSEHFLKVAIIRNIKTRLKKCLVKVFTKIIFETFLKRFDNILDWVCFISVSYTHLTLPTKA